MKLNNGLKIMSIDATDLFQYDTEKQKVVPSNLSSFYDYVDEDGKTIQLRKPNLFKMKLDASMGLDELGRQIADRRMTKEAIFKVRRKEATNQVVHVTFKYSTFKSTTNEKDEKGKVKKYKVDGYTKETIRDKVYENGFTIDGIKYVRWERSGSSARDGKCFFINEELEHAMNLFTDCGIKPNEEELNLASFEAYRALVLSNKIDDLVIKPENILLIDDVITAGTAIRESEEIIKANGAHFKAALIALNRMEKGKGEKSAIAEAEAQIGIKIISIVTFDDLLKYIENDDKLKEHIPAMLEYRKQYGA